MSLLKKFNKAALYVVLAGAILTTACVDLSAPPEITADAEKCTVHITSATAGITYDYKNATVTRAGAYRVRTAAMKDLPPLVTTRFEEIASQADVTRIFKHLPANSKCTLPTF